MKSITILPLLIFQVLPHFWVSTAWFQHFLCYHLLGLPPETNVLGKQWKFLSLEKNHNLVLWHQAWGNRLFFTRLGNSEGRLKERCVNIFFFFTLCVATSPLARSFALGISWQVLFQVKTPVQEISGLPGWGTTKMVMLPKTEGIFACNPQSHTSSPGLFVRLCGRYFF